MAENNQREALSIGFIGGGLDSAVGYTHFVASRMDNRFRLVAGCFSEERHMNQETAAAYGVHQDRLYATWTEMLSREKEQLDAVVILTPTPTHCEIVKACLKEGMPVICEKALCVDGNEAAEIIRTKEKYNGFLAVTYNYSGYPMVRELRRLIVDGALGRILHFQIEMPQEGYCRVDAQGNKPIPQAWRMHDGKIPTLYLDLAVHLHQLIHYVTGKKPLEVMADQASYGWFDVVDNVSCLCRYSDDVKGQMWFGKSALGHRNGLKIRIYGSEASAEWLQSNPEELLVSRADGTRQILDRGSNVAVASAPRYTRFKVGHPAGFIEAFANLYWDIADSLAQYTRLCKWNSEEVFGVELAEEGLQQLEAMTRSLDSKRWEKCLHEELALSQE